MKTIKFFFILLLSAQNAMAQNPTNNNINLKKDSTMNYDQFIAELTGKLNKNVEMFDSARYNSLRSERKEADLNVSETLNDGTFIGMSDYDTSERYMEIPKDNPFCLVKIYYPNGSISDKGISYVGGFRVGTWYHFMPDGGLTMIQNCDNLHKVTWRDMIRICEERNYPIRRGIEGHGADIYLLYDKTLNIWKWVISYDETPFLRNILSINADTGEVVKDEKKELSY